MSGYRALVDVSHMNTTQQRRKARTIKAILVAHPGLQHRTGQLSRSAYVHLYEDIGLLVAGADAPYASFLNLGQGSLKRKYAYVEAAVSRVIGRQYIKDLQAQ